MSERPQGQGWWQASDGKWYPPESRPLPPPPPNAPTPPAGRTPPQTQNQPPRPGRRWLKVVLIIVGAIAALAVLGNLVGEDPPSSGGTDAGSPTTARQSRSPGVGDEVRDGKFAFVVTAVENPGTIYDPDNALQDEAVGTWFVVHVTVSNIGDREQTFFASNQELIWQGRTYEAEGFAWNGTNLEQLNPGLSLDAVLLFDVPTGFPQRGRGTEVELHDSAFSGGVKVDL